MGTKYLADTTVVIEHLRGNPKAKQFLMGNNPYISTVTIAELIQGARDKDELAAVLKICASLREVAIDKNISHKAIDLLRNFNLSRGLLFLDALIAGTAMENKLTLVTGNVKHFRNLAGLRIVSQETVFTT